MNAVGPDRRSHRIDLCGTGSICVLWDPVSTRENTFTERSQAWYYLTVIIGVGEFRKEGISDREHEARLPTLRTVLLGSKEISISVVVWCK